MPDFGGTGQDAEDAKKRKNLEKNQKNLLTNRCSGGIICKLSDERPRKSREDSNMLYLVN